MCQIQRETDARKCSVKICSEKYAKSAGKHLWRILFFNKVACWRFTTLLKQDLFQRHLLCGTQVKQTAASVSYANTYGYIKHSRSVSNVILKIFKKIYFHFISLTLKELRGFDPSPVVFPKMCFIERLQNPVFLWLFL